jgi:hypothetical protein
MTTPEQLKIKVELLQLCENILLERIKSSTSAMQHAQESANSEDKNSAGDKYETGRAAGQLESEMHGVNLKKHRIDLAFLKTLDPKVIHTQCGLGAAVRCTGFFFFISLGLGSADHSLGKIFMLSTQAPLAESMKGKKVGETFLMNGTAVKILEIF